MLLQAHTPPPLASRTTAPSLFGLPRWPIPTKVLFPRPDSSWTVAPPFHWMRHPPGEAGCGLGKRGYGGKDFYDVSCVDGFNLPVLVVPSGGPNCNSTSCPVNVNVLCPQELRITAPDPRVNMINGKSTLGAVGSRVSKECYPLKI
ncbi:hypothetical protein C4D60_Mb08t12280 [Musa balbisiana]|uniref:Uncharacterized protein n=1 Tax=Musa balbisiana TaxID=52838 RepID=A0A4S8K373_MUSBA|nr:hypothetical protein C4D60_Mb08t12280 [Musa balbisiana]